MKKLRLRNVIVAKQQPSQLNISEDAEGPGLFTSENTEGES